MSEWGEPDKNLTEALVWIIVLLLLALLLFGCAPALVSQPVTIVKTVKVKVPIAVSRTPPAQLMQGYHPDSLPEFVPPSDKSASSALTPTGEQRLKLIIHDLLARLEAWRAWAIQPGR